MFTYHKYRFPDGYIRYFNLIENMHDLISRGSNDVTSIKACWPT